MASDSAEFSVADESLLEQVVNFRECGSLQDLSNEKLRSLVTDRGIDFATALLYDRVVSSAENCEAIEELKRLGSASPSSASPSSASPSKVFAADTTLAVAPGAFYREYPETGADGERIRKAAETLGCQTELIPTKSVGTVDENAETIVEWLLRNRSKRVVLVSLSKGGADIKVALKHSDASKAFGNVVAWINVGGITSGSPIVTWFLSQRIRYLYARLIFWWWRRNLRFLHDLDRRQGAPLGFPLEIPNHIKLIHLVGFPMRRHLSTKYSRTWHRRLAEHGPNDGAMVLFDSCQLPGVVYPIWGADHYSVDRVDWGQLTRGVLRFVEPSPGSLVRDKTASRPPVVTSESL